MSTPSAQRPRSVFLTLARICVGLCLLVIVASGAIVIFDVVPVANPAGFGGVVGQLVGYLLLGALILFVIGRVRR